MECNRLFQIVNNPGFWMLMKMGWPDCYIPSAKMLSCDVRKIFVCVHRHISKMLKVISVCLFCCKRRTYLVQQEFNGKLNFATDAWSSPNHKAYVAFTVHLEDQGKPMLMLLDIVEVVQLHTGVILGKTFVEILKVFGIEKKVSFSSVQTK
jgi:hypothetical protein